MQMLDRRDEWLAGSGHQLVFQWSDLAKSFAYRAESSDGLVEKLKDLLLTSSGGGDGVGAEAVEGLQDGHGRLHVHRQERSPARREQEDRARD